jgi:heavy metal sensor kinase
MFFTTLRAKLVVWYTLVLAVTFLAFSSILYFFLNRALHDSVDKKLKTIAEITADSTTRSPEDSEKWNEYLEDFFGFKPTTKYISIFDKSGNVDYGTEGERTVKIPITAETIKNAKNGEITFETIEGLDEHPIRVINYPVIRDNRLVNFVQVGTSLEYVQDTLMKLLFIFLFTVPTILIFSSIGGYFLAKAALRPVDEITSLARSIGAKDLSQRIKVRNPKDELGRLAATFNDMLERLRKSFDQAKQFSADASHELRTPLTILKGESEWALRSARNAKEYKATLTSNLEEIDHMSKIIDDLLILSRADSGEIPFELEPLELSPILRDVYDMGTMLAEKKGQELHLDIDGIDSVSIMGNELKLKQLFLNLVDNGLKYTKKGGRIDMTGRVNSDTVEIRVTDNGIGISGDDQKKIFDRFYRVDKNRSRKEGGTGLGLAISRFITEAHGGTINVTSTPGIGSTFSVVIPLSDN